MRRRIIAFSLLLMLILSGCGGGGKEIVVANVGDVPVTMSEFEFYLNSVKEQMQGTELSSDEDWLNNNINGKKAIEVAKEQALDIAAKNISYKLIYEKMGNSFSDDDKKTIAEYKEGIVNQYAQTGGYEQFLKEANITDEFVDMLCESMFCSDWLYTEFSAEQEISDAEAEAYFDEHYDEQFAQYRRAKHVLILTQDPETGVAYSDEKRADAKEKADKIYKNAVTGSDFDALVAKYSEDPGSASYSEGYTFTDGEMMQEFQDCVDSLNPGEIGFTETSYGYHIIKRFELDKSYFTEDIKAMILSDNFMEYIDEKMNEYGIVVEEKEEINQVLTINKA